MICVSRIVLHSDANSFYASCELLFHPELAGKPVAVGGDPEARHGIVLAKNELAKACGVKTAEVLWQARRKCPGLVVLSPHYELYLRYSMKLRKIYSDYTDRIEAFGLDENWLDISERGLTVERGREIAEQIRIRAKETLGITVSIGVSFNKVFAKLGSDYKKPDAVTMISERNFRELVWPLPTSELLYVGSATAHKLGEIGVRTIGQLAALPESVAQGRLGKNGLMLKAFAMGRDDAEVLPTGAEGVVKSVGNSTTTPHDIETFEDAKRIYYLLVESVAARLREQGFRTRCVSISARTADLQVAGCQRALKQTTNLTSELARASVQLFEEHFMGRLPLRSVGVCCSDLTPEDAPTQIDMFGVDARRERLHALDVAVDGLRQRFGHQALQRGIVLADPAFARINPRIEAGPQGVAFVMGNRGNMVLGGC